MENFKIHIPRPCHQDWNKMVPEGEGRFCSACSKVVVDFTSMSDEEVKQYFTSRHGERICGHFRISQTEVFSSPLHRSLSRWYDFLESRITIGFVKATALFVLGVFMIMTGCRPRTVGEKMPYKDKDSVSAGKEQQLTGDTICNSPKDPVILQGEIDAPPPEDKK